MYEYSFILERVVDGDTVIGTVDLGFNTYVKQTFRLANINTPELNSSDPILKEQANKAKAYTSAFFVLDEKAIAQGDRIVVKSIKPITKDKYGRYLGIFLCGTRILNEELVNNGLAVKY